jgi:anti-sigma regulatory factor (Ser/Thr protein kinase)
MGGAGQDQTAADRGITSWDGASAQSLAQALIPPAVDCVEASLSGPNPRSTRRAASSQRLGLAVTTSSVYRHPIARLFAGALKTRLDLSADLHDRVHTALQEAMMNAMLHGNLGLDSSLRDNLQALAASRDIIEARLASEQVAHGTIRVDATWSTTKLRIVVRDSGSGFKRNELPSQDGRLGAGGPGGGQGLVILEALCDHIGLRHGGTTIALDFLRSNRPDGALRDAGCKPR